MRPNLLDTWLLAAALAAVGACAKPAAPAPVVEATVDDPAPASPLDTGAVALTATAEIAPVPAPTGLDPTVADLPTVTYTLRRGETLAHFARWADLPLETVAAASGLSPLDDDLPVGTVVKVPADEDARARIESRRDAHRFRRTEGWLATHGGEVGTEFYRVRTGDSAWTIARGHGEMPVWVLESYNPAVDLERLRPGQDLLLPVVASRVAADE